MEDNDKLIHADAKLSQKIKIVAAIKGITMQKAVNEALEQYLKVYGVESKWNE